MTRKICFFTGSRAEYGILAPLMRAVQERPDCTLQIVATNMHLSPEYGMTVDEIYRDGFTPDAKVEMLLSSDTPTGTAKSLGLGIIGYADAIDRLQPDIIVILGDRYEMLGVAQTALLFNIPIAHLHGGEVTLGAYDDAIRNAITCMSSLHFTSTEEYRQNVIRLGADPEHTFCVGAPGVENIRHTEFISRDELEKDLDFPLDGDLLVATFHPVTRQPGDAQRQIDQLTAALSPLLNRLKVIFTLPNSDAEGRAITAALRDFEAKHPDTVKCVHSLGRTRYFSLVKQSHGVIGNSSSGLIEAPSLGVPTVNIGDRQKGRAQGDSIINCECTANAIAAAIAECLSPEMQTLAKHARNPYEGHDTIRAIADILATKA